MRKSTPFLVAIALMLGSVACSDSPFEPMGDLGVNPGVNDADPIQFPVDRPLVDNGELKEVDEDEI